MTTMENYMRCACCFASCPDSQAIKTNKQPPVVACVLPKAPGHPLTFCHPHSARPMLLNQLSREGACVVTTKHGTFPIVHLLRVQLHQRGQQLAECGAAVGLVARDRIRIQVQVSQRADLAAEAVDLLQTANLDGIKAS